MPEDKPIKTKADPTTQQHPSPGAGKEESTSAKATVDKKEVSASAEAMVDKKETAEPEKSSGGSSGKKKVLIVEDEKPLAHALELKLSHEGFETQIVSDGAQALEKAKEFKPDIILLDLIMPCMDGFTFLEELKKEGAKTAVIVLSNLGQDEDRKRAEEYGVKGYFVKANTPISDIVKQVKAAI
ncbi:response regulator [Patescibacteria group bacterium]|nr:response regulator [Patescibacteria group bacterium]MBU1124104.1 response regulator [Patescibacteria group bacterium]MBU1911394.1 response regulator [Patescibacteria group bacterium]